MCVCVGVCVYVLAESSRVTLVFFITSQKIHNDCMVTSSTRRVQ